MLVNYAVPPEVLRPRLPEGVELDDEDGAHYVSLVAFRFHETRVRALRIPAHHDFLETNLRFYVRRSTSEGIRRGVVFVKEIVPRCAIALVARVGYGEPYEAWRISRSFTEDRLAYEWSRPREGRHRVEVRLGADLGIPDEGGHEAFLLEHYWGYTRRGPERTDEYRVEHPRWRLREASDARVECDFAALYGPEYGILNGASPRSVIFAQGSPVAVYRGAPIRLH